MGVIKMSLINQMLQDLAQREPTQINALQQIPLRTVSARRKSIPIWIWIAIVGIASANGLGWLWWQYQPTPSHPATTRPAQTALAATIVNPVAIAPVSAPTPPVAPLPETIVATPAPAATNYSATALTPTLNLSMSMSKSIGTPHPLPTKPANTIEAPQYAASSINKQIKPLTNVQLAENEYRKALAFAQQGRINEAMESFTQALTLDPHHHGARLTLIGLLIGNKRMAEAERRLQEGLQLDIDQTDLALVLARVQIERNAVNDAIATLERSLPYAAEQADYHAFLAALLQRAGRQKAAIEHYVIALKKSPQSGLWWMGLGISLQADNQPDKAREAFSRAKLSNNLSPDLLAFVNQQLIK